MQRETQTASYWVDDFAITESDVDEVFNELLEAEVPVPTAKLVEIVISYRVQQEEQRLRRSMEGGKLYQPRDDYDVGQKLAFPAFDFATGEVIGKRKGHNPTRGDFKVIEVKMEDGTIREFAAALKSEHKLNLLPDSDLWKLFAAQHDVSGLVKEYGGVVATALEEALGGMEDVARFLDGWVLSSALADVHIGHLNIAEALIDVSGEPVTAAAIVEELDLPADMPQEMKELSLERMLLTDDRFRRVETVEGIRWFLTRLLPKAVVETPPGLLYTPVDYDHQKLDVNQRQLEWEIGDEWSVVGDPTAVSMPEETPAERLTARQSVIPPHHYAHTLPLNQRIAAILPSFKANLGMITLVDGRWGNQFNAWVVKDRRYIAGLDKWYSDHKVPIGTIVLLESTKMPGEYRIDIKPKRMKREWVRTATVVQDTLTFEMLKQEINCEVDDYIVLGLRNEADVLALAKRLDWGSVSITDIVHYLVQDLAKLSPQGNVHAKTVYSALNLLRRCPPGPVLAALSDTSRYRKAGDNYYALAI